MAIHAWEEWGEDSFRRFNGQWALALWDRQERRLVLARDRVGICPLFYARTSSEFVFASEIKALFAHRSLSREFDPAGLAQVFSYWSAVAPATVFRGVQQLPPGHCGTLDADGRFTSHPYWRSVFPAKGAERPGDAREHAEELVHHLREATRLRFLRSDVPVGAYLSGGIDSAVLVAILARESGVPLTTFSLRFQDDEFDEGPYQRLMSQRLGTDHHEVSCRRSEIGRLFPRVVLQAETPLLRAGPAPMLLLSGLVAEQGYKVVMTGEGADEILAGYDLFREARVRRFWARYPESGVRRRAVELLYPWMVRSPASAPAFAHSFFSRNLDPSDPALSHRPRWDSTQALHGLLSDELAHELTTEPWQSAMDAMPTDNDRWDPLSRAQWLEMHTLLPGYLLSSQGDRMLMANGVEGRYPFLDPDVVDFCHSLPSSEKLYGLEEKHLLKRAFGDELPHEILHRPKQPYRAPDASSFFGPSSPDWFDDLLHSRLVAAAGVFEPARIEKLLVKCRRTSGLHMSNTDNMRVLAVVSTQLLHQHMMVDNRDDDRLPPLHVTADLALTEGGRSA